MTQSHPSTDESFSNLEHVFVYGTLKRGECREDLWPKRAVRIEPAWTLGTLIDLGLYPALLIGHDRVLGELWSFHPQDMPNIFEVLDGIEGTNQPGLPNEYDRVRVTAIGQTQGAVDASTYRYANQQQADRFPTMSATLSIGGQLYVQWLRWNRPSLSRPIQELPRSE